MDGSMSVYLGYGIGRGRQSTLLLSVIILRNTEILSYYPN